MMNSSIKSFSCWRLYYWLAVVHHFPHRRLRAQGVSHDTCYLAEQQRQTAILSASEAQAFKNAEAAQHTQRQRKPFIKDLA